jgi:hypothetical protein
MISRVQYKKLMKSYLETGKITASASKAGMDRKTAVKYIRGGDDPLNDCQDRFGGADFFDLLISLSIKG